MNSAEQRSIREFEEKAKELVSLMYAMTEAELEKVRVPGPVESVNAEA